MRCTARVNIPRFGPLPVGGAFLGGGGGVNTAGTDEEGLAPRSVKGRNVSRESDDGCGQTIDLRQLQGGCVEDLARISAARSRGGEILTKLGGIAHREKDAFMFGLIAGDG